MTYYILVMHLSGTCIPHLRVSMVAQWLKYLPTMQETWVQSLGWEDPLGGGNGNPLKYSCLENSMDRRAWKPIAYGVSKSKTQLSEHLFYLFYFYAL